MFLYIKNHTVFQVLQSNESAAIFICPLPAICCNSVIFNLK